MKKNEMDMAYTHFLGWSIYHGLWVAQEVAVYTLIRVAFMR